MLAPGTASRLVVDELVESGTSPNTAALNAVVQMLRTQSGKPVSLRGPIPLNDSLAVHTTADIARLADAQGTKQGDGTAVIHLLYLKGRYEKDGVLGVTIRADTIAVFPDQIASAASALVSPARIEQAVVTHEIGHVLGLVDLFLNDHRQDPDHPGHSSNPRSVMYWAVESDLISQVLTGQPPVDFDGADLADLSRIHGGANPEAR